MLTCKKFLQELNDFLDDTLEPNAKEELLRHVNECPNCWVLCDTSQKTLRVFKGMEPQSIPSDVHSRLMAALERRMAAKGPLGHCKEE